MLPPAWQAQHELFERALVALMELPTPVIAAVNGHAYGGGLEMALACDFAYAARGGRFALSETRLGIMPDGAGTQNLARAVVERRAKELIPTAKAFSAEDGLAGGAFNQICRRTCSPATASKSRPITASWTPRTGAKACGPSMEKRKPVFLGRWHVTSAAKAERPRRASCIGCLLLLLYAPVNVRKNWAYGNYHPGRLL